MSIFRSPDLTLCCQLTCIPCTEYLPLHIFHISECQRDLPQYQRQKPGLHPVSFLSASPQVQAVLKPCRLQVHTLPGYFNHHFRRHSLIISLTRTTQTAEAPCLAAHLTTAVPPPPSEWSSTPTKRDPRTTASFGQEERGGILAVTDNHDGPVPPCPSRQAWGGHTVQPVRPVGKHSKDF